jgi:alkaline phosphatase
MPYDIDRDTTATPSLEEMTRTAISKLSQNEKGFFLMVEGSKIDWAAHANDPMGMASDYLAFDRACAAALEFAKANGETAVIIVPDHGNSGISLGSSRCSNYSKLTKDQLFGQFAQYKLTSEGFQAMLNSRPASEVQNIFRTYAGFELNDDELKMLYNNKGYKNSPIPLEERAKGPELESLYSGSLSGFIAKLLTSKTCFGFTTGGHTGEEVFLAAYHPEGDVPMGVLTNVDLNHYMCALFEIKGELDEMSNQTFAKHTDVFKGYKYEIVPSTEKNGTPTLVVKSKKKQLTIKPFTNLIQTGKKGTETIKLNSVVVYVDKNNTFYLPSDLAKHL